MTALAPTLQAFFVSRLGRQRDASPHTVDSYRHAFRLLLAYAEAQTGNRSSRMDLADLDAVLVSGFLDHLEDDRGSSVASRNTRLAAGPLLLPLRVLPAPRARRDDPAGAGHPPQEDPEHPPVLSHEHRDGRRRLRARPLHLVRPS
jgi:site-specific recombinase XerC